MGKAERYRDRADGLRAIAGDMPEDNTKRIILSIAREYDRLAGVLETEGSTSDPLSTIAALKKPEDSN
jgi:hypothetical protein